MVRASKISIPKINKNFKAAISENKMEEVVIDNTDYDDVAQFEALDNFGKDSVSNNVEEESWSTLNYSDLKDILENRMLHDNSEYSAKNAEEAVHRSKWVTRSCTRTRIEFSILSEYSICSSTPR